MPTDMTASTNVTMLADMTAAHSVNWLRSNPGVLLTAEELACYVRRPRRGLIAAARRGTIPHLRVGRRVLFRSDAIVRWLDAATVAVQPGAQPGPH
jgi:excisionase family DNA binding protein